MIPISSAVIASLITITGTKDQTDKQQTDIPFQPELNPTNVAVPKGIETVVEEDENEEFFDCEEEFETSIDEPNELTVIQDDIIQETVEEEYFSCEEDEISSEEPPVTLFTQDEYNEMYGVEPEEEHADGWLAWAIKKGSDVAQKGVAFSQGVIGSKLIATGKSMVAENVGMMIGTAFPEATVAYTVARHVASSKLEDSENKSYFATGIGVTAALTVTALSTGLSYLTGTPMEYNRALGYMVTAAGTIAGGMGGLETTGHEVSLDYIPRTAAYMATTGVVGTVANGVTTGVSTVAEYVPLPLVPTATHVVGKVATSVAGMAAYYGDTTVVVAERMMNPKSPTRDLFDPGEFTQNVATHANGDTKAFSEAMAKKLVESPLLASITRLLIQHTVDRKIATNALVRAVNEFAIHMQSATVQEKIRELRANPDQLHKEALQKEIAALVAQEYTGLEKLMDGKVKTAFDPMIPTLIKQITDLMGRKEVEFFGMTLSDDKQTTILLEALLPVLIPMVSVYVKRRLISTRDLSKDEVETFYGDISAALLAPYSEYRLGRGLQTLIATAIPFMQQYAQFLPSLLSESIGQSLADPVINLDENAPKVEEQPREKSAWEKIREKINLIRYLIQFVGWKKFVEVAKAAFLNLFMKKEPGPE